MPPKKPWPVLRTYDADHLARIALPLGGIGTGTFSLGGRGDLRDWELMNRPAKGFVPGDRSTGHPCFVLWARPAGAPAAARLLEGPLDLDAYEGASGATLPNHGLPRFRECTFAAAYPLGQVALSDPEMPVSARLEAFNPLVPGDAEKSGLPLASLRWVLRNRTARRVAASICFSLPNFVGSDGLEGQPRQNRNRMRQGPGLHGLLLDSLGVDRRAPQWGTLALATTARSGLSWRTAWKAAGWGTSLLDFWDDFAGDGRLEERPAAERDMPTASLAVRLNLEPRATREITFLLAWHFPNRYTWTPQEDCCGEGDWIGNHYATRYGDAWDVLEKTAPHLRRLEEDTLSFVRAFCAGDLPAAVKEAALSNLSTLRSPTCFRTADGHFYGWEGCNDRAGCCLGSCTHVWNYELATPFLFAGLARSMREVEFLHATDEKGLMSFRVHLPLERARSFGRAAADGQMGCIVKMYRDWQLSGEQSFLEKLWPSLRRALEFCWIEGGWDADGDGVMEGCQHNTMDVEYYGPNPQMGFWYLAALRAAEQMALHLGEAQFADKCRRLFAQGSRYLDEELFNGEYYEHQVRPPKSSTDVAPGLRVGMGAADLSTPEYQLGPGCLVDQLVGQLLAHVCGLGHLTRPEHVRRTLKSIYKYNRRTDLHAHFNCMRSYALADEAALLMASYPGERPANPFPYFTEVMTGFEYAAAVGMLYEGQERQGLRCIADIRARYDGARRNPFDEAECGHHYARAMASWGAVLALSGFRYSGVDRSMTFAAREGTFFWSNGTAWGTCALTEREGGMGVALQVLGGDLTLERFALTGCGSAEFARARRAGRGRTLRFSVAAR